MESSPPSISLLSFLLCCSFFIPSSDGRQSFGISSIIPEELYNSMFLHKDDSACPGKGFYNYSSFIQATGCFPQFGRAGDLTTRKREVAAFLAQISHETTGKALGFDGLRNPELVSNNSVIAFKTALWFWMTPQKPKPSCHDVMVGRYRPTQADLKANRTAGFGLVTNIINGGLECGLPDDNQVNNRIGFYQRYAQLLDVDTGPNLDCANQKSF